MIAVITVMKIQANALLVMMQAISDVTTVNVFQEVFDGKI